ncbi:NADH dehydrogenase, alpha subcomplex, subunit 6 [Rhizophagus clarus]|uniref:NADH dehydrogenase, alpha subcomplex, subunit 6 n=1 Tax=Rhizophagus clarus TaxID=94130 RepID=A0A8H3QXU3_9GLOM|nr:NADH dehydrogenase, alpha subcomplex, subunit 6 [Rhizophagus clarus]
MSALAYRTTISPSLNEARKRVLQLYRDWQRAKGPKGRAEYQETVNIWKMDTHIMNYFSKEESPPKPRSFLENFYEGRD